MENSAKKFSVPDDIDDSFQDSTTELRPRCFQPGMILKPDDSKSGQQDSIGSKKESTKSCDDTSKEYIILTSEKECSVRSNRNPASKFESEFGNLRESKFYENTNSDTTNEKSLNKPTSSSSLLVNPRQRGNPLLKQIRNVPWEFSEIEPDYVMGKTACALFLSLRYHNLYPNYIHDRLKALGKSFSLRVLLVQVDVAEPNPPLKDLSVISILADCTLMVSWSAEEAGSYLETYKMYENKSADLIKEKQDSSIYAQLIDSLTTIRSINKTDAMVLLSNFKTLKGIVNATVEELAQCPGLGPLKAKRLYDALRKPFRKHT